MPPHVVDHRRQRVRHGERHQQDREAAVDLAQHGEPGGVGADKVWHRDYAEKQRRHLGGCRAAVK